MMVITMTAMIMVMMVMMMVMFRLKPIERALVAVDPNQRGGEMTMGGRQIEIARERNGRETENGKKDGKR